MTYPNKDIVIGDNIIKAGERTTVDVPMASLYTHSPIDMTVHVVNGKRPGPRLFISAAIHGDEINGVEIIRRLLQQKQLSKLKGSLLAIPVVNVHGFVTQSRYLPDGRDLNRSFPGSAKGSLAGRMASAFLENIVNQCTHGIDLHTGSRHRSNLPQIRANLSDPTAMSMAVAFDSPVVIDANIRDGSLRATGNDLNIPIILYEAGEALRFDEVAIRAGVQGILNNMRMLGMLPQLKRRKTPNEPFVAKHTAWVRAPQSGMIRMLLPLGAKTTKGNTIAVISDPLGDSESLVNAPRDGIIIGRTNLPLVHEGEAIFHVAHYTHTDEVADRVEEFQEAYEPEFDITDDDVDITNAPVT